ncbi:MAG: hypothetical protein HYS08_01970 [Chlamydiae bacterium]|nr:hypothetical protein [Chlamydiota bacterium]MBI3266590.1 hypothetical protein [Chlamydiota bacterium]
MFSFRKRKSELESLKKQMRGFLVEHEELQKTRTLLHQLTNDLVEKNQKLQEKSEKLLRMDQLKSDFISVASHELRTPLAVLRECISSLLEDGTGEVGQETQDYLVIAKSNIERLITLTKELLDISKLESGKMRIHREKQNVVTLIYEAAQSLRTLFERQGIKVELPSSQEEIPPIFCDPTRIIQVLVNLMGNALKNVPREKGLVKIQIKKKPDFLEIQVIDNGCGIPKDKLVDIFDKFVQVHNPVAPGSEAIGKGMGLGLTICKAIVEQHHGTIWAESELGVGSNFTFALPIFNSDLQFHDLLEEALIQATARDEKLSLLLINVEKTPQDTDASHPLKREWALNLEEKIRSRLRSGDALLKYHAAEYIMVLAKTDKSGSSVMESRIRETLKSHIPSTLEFKTSVVTYPEDGKNQIELIREAENKLKK